MTDIRAISDLETEPLDDAAWDSFVAPSPEGYFLQASRWDTIKARFGWEVERSR